jgi:integrase/recombinase XerD
LKKATFIINCCFTYSKEFLKKMGYSKEWLTEEEVKKLLELPNIDDKYEIWILLLYTPALRITEALNVQVRDLIIEKKEINVIGGKKRKAIDIEPVPCNPQVLKQIEKYCDRSDLKPSDYVMFSNKGKQADRSWVYKKLNELCQEAGIYKKIGTHTMRRSRAAHMLSRGITLAKVSKYLRHKNLATTMAYLMITTADIQKELEELGDPVTDIINGGF